MQQNSRIAVAGATGRVGRHVVDVLESRGYDVVPISRSHGVDVITGEGLDEALAGVETIIDVATGPSPDQRAATDFFTASTGNLQEAGDRPACGGWSSSRSSASTRSRAATTPPSSRRSRRTSRTDPGTDPARGAVPRVRGGADAAGARRAT